MPAKGQKHVEIPFAVRLAIRNLYLAQGLAPEAIAAKLKRPVLQVAKIISRDGLPALRREQNRALQARGDEQRAAQLAAFNDELAAGAEEISLGALTRARSAVASKSKFAPRDFQSWTGGIRNLVSAARAVRGLESLGSRGANHGGEGLTVAFFLARGEVITAGEKRAEPVPVEALQLPAPAVPSLG